MELKVPKSGFAGKDQVPCSTGGETSGDVDMKLKPELGFEGVEDWPKLKFAGADITEIIEKKKKKTNNCLREVSKKCGWMVITPVCLFVALLLLPLSYGYRVTIPKMPMHSETESRGPDQRGGRIRRGRNRKTHRSTRHWSRGPHRVGNSQDPHVGGYSRGAGNLHRRVTVREEGRWYAKHGDYACFPGPSTVEDLHLWREACQRASRPRRPRTPRVPKEPRVSKYDKALMRQYRRDYVCGKSSYNTSFLPYICHAFHVSMQ